MQYWLMYSTLVQTIVVMDSTCYLNQRLFSPGLLHATDINILPALEFDSSLYPWTLIYSSLESLEHSR